MSVELHMFSAHIRWADYPHGDPEELFVKFTQTNDNISVLLPVPVNQTEYLTQSILLPDHEYFFEVCAFTGGIGDAINCSQNVTMRIMEGGMLLFIKWFT